MNADDAISVTQNRWDEILSEKLDPGSFDKNALLYFAKRGRCATLHSPIGKLVNDGFLTPLTVRNNVTGELLTRHLHVIKFYPTDPQYHNSTTYSIEFKSRNHPETGEECVCEFGNWRDDSDEEEKEECYNILESFFPLYSEYDIKEPVDF